MKNLILTICALVVCAVTFGQTTTTATGVANDSSYVVKVGDNLWSVSQKLHNNPFLWEKFVADNPFLQETGRVEVKGPGKIFVRIYPGETLNQSALQTPVVVPAKVAPVVKAVTVVAPVTDYVTNILWILLVLAVIGLIYLLIRKWQKNKEENEVHENAVEAGPAQVRGGVNDGTIEAVLASRYPNIRLSNLERGNIFGEGITSYGDNRERRTRYNGEVAYRALATYEDNTQEMIYCLQACGNDARMGGGIRGRNIRFVPEVRITEGQPMPLTVAPAQVMAGPADLTKIASEAVGSVQSGGGKLNITFADGNMTIELEKRSTLPATLMFAFADNHTEKPAAENATVSEKKN